MEINQTPFHQIRTSKILYPIVIGLGVVLFMFIREFNPDDFNLLTFGHQALFFLFLCFVCMICRDLGYIIRLRILTNNALSWLQSFRVVMLWEFTSAVTPSAIGGTSIAMLFVHKEGINLGRSTAVVLATSFLDELYFIIMFPLLLLFISHGHLFSITEIINGETVLSFRSEFFVFAIVGYTVKVLYLALVGYGLFINPRGFKWLLLKIFQLPIIKRWRIQAAQTGSEIVLSSKELKRQSIFFWIKAFGATAFSWTSRYLVVNMLLLAFFLVPDHFLLFARQLVMWIMMLVSPTPGGSGFAEFVFTRYLTEFIPVGPDSVASIAVLLAFMWRVISYYPYLFIGVIILPKWITSKFKLKKIKRASSL